MSTPSSGIRNTRKKLLRNNEDLVFEYFRLIKNKDIARLMDLFDPDAVVYEPFSKLTGGLRGKQAIESFLKVAIMANDTLQHQIVIEKESDINKPQLNNNNDNNDTRNKKNNNNDNDIKAVTALVMFEKGDSLRARFSFEFSSDQHDNNDDNENNPTSSKHNKIKALRIQFIT